MFRARTVRVLAAVTFGSVLGILPATTSAQGLSPSLAGVELLEILGDGVIGAPESAPTLRDPGRIARWETGEWQYRITSGSRRGQTEVESLALIKATARGETWKRTIGQDSTLYLREVTGGIRATTVYAGVYRVTTPAGAFRAALIKTEYQIDILAVVSVRDTLYTFYAEGVGKVSEAEHQRIAAMGLFNSYTKIGKVLVSYTSVGPPIRVE